MNGSAAKHMRHFFSGTFLSRVSGMVRDVAMAAAFGDHPSVASFMVAFRFSHFLRRLLGEGPLQSIFIPQYEELRLKDERKAQAFFFRLTFLMVVLLLGIVVLFEGGAILYPGEHETLKLFKWMVPSLFFICLYGLNISLLQCHHSFFTSSVAPFACNLMWIIGVFALSKRVASEAMIGLTLFIVVGFVVQWLITLPKTWPHLVKGWSDFKRPIFAFPLEIRAIGKATVFGVIGVAAVQINSVLDMIFARFADVRGPIYLWYAIRLEQLPMALIGFACVYTLVPSITRHIKANEVGQAQDLFLFGYQRIFLLIVPCTFALFALSSPSVNLLFGRGQFSEPAVVETTFCLWAYGLSLLPATMAIYQASLFYAYGNYRTPTLSSVASIVTNILLNALFVFGLGWGAVSIALSTAISSWVNVIILRRSTTMWQINYPSPLSFAKIFVVSLIAFAGTVLFDNWYLGSTIFGEGFALPRSFVDQSLHFLSQLICFTTIFAVGLLLFYREMLTYLKNLVVSRTPS